MDAQTGHSFEILDGVSFAGPAGGVEVADVRKTTGTMVDGLSLDLLQALTLLARDRVREGSLQLVGEGGLLPLLTQELMQAALEAEMDLHLESEGERVGGRGSRSGGNSRSGYRAKKVITEVGPVTVQVPRDRLGTFRPKVLPAAHGGPARWMRWCSRSPRVA